MRRSTTSFCPRAEAARRVGLAAATVLAAAQFACVLPSTHREVVEERDLLARRNAALEASNESLESERVELVAEVELLHEEYERLTAQVADLTERRDALEQQVRSREEALDEASEQVSQLRDTYDGLVNDLQDEVASGRIQIEQLREGLRVRLAQAVLFPSGSAELRASGREVLVKVSERLAKLDDRVQVHGHTDDRPIQGRLATTYPSNWELGGARAAAVVRLLAENGVAPERLMAVSFGSTRPVAPNDDPEHRELNRRIEIRLIPTGTDPVPEVASGEPDAPDGPTSRADDVAAPAE